MTSKDSGKIDHEGALIKHTRRYDETGRLFLEIHVPNFNSPTQKGTLLPFDRMQPFISIHVYTGRNRWNGFEGVSGVCSGVPILGTLVRNSLGNY